MCEARRPRDAARGLGVRCSGADPVGAVPAAAGADVGVGQAAVERRNRIDPEARERFVDGADEADPPAVGHEHDAIALGEVLDRVCREHDRRRAVGQRAQVGDEVGARRRVEAGCGLVEEEHPRVGEQLGGDAGTLALSPAQRADSNVGVLGEADRGDGGADRFVDLGGGRRRREPEPGCVAE